MAARRRLWLPPPEAEEEEEEVNHFNLLPDDVVLHIFSFLPFRDLVQTSLLCRHWRYAWISVPHIDLSPPSRGAPESDLCSRTELDWRFHFAAARRAEDASSVGGRRRPDVPRTLCGCALLVGLRVSGCSPWDVTIHWPLLEKLCVRDDSTDDDGTTRISSRCPVLESLKLRLLCHLRIDSRSLRELTIDSVSVFSLEISAPNLPSLRLSGGFALEGFRLNAASSSADAESDSTNPSPGSLRRGFFAEGLNTHLEQLQHGVTLRRGLVLLGLSSLSMVLLMKYVGSR